MGETSCIYKCLAAKYDIFLAAQHNADESVKTTHVHFLVDISGTQHLEAKQPLESFRKTLKGFDLRAQLTKETYQLLTLTQDTKEPYKEFELAVYILKGDRTAPTTYSSWYTQDFLDLRYDAWQAHERSGLGRAQAADEAHGGAADPETKLVSARKITDWQLLKKLIWEIPISGTEFTYGQHPDRMEVNPRTLLKHVVAALKSHDLKPTPRRVNEFVGSMLMFFNDTQDQYQEIAIGKFMFTFDQYHEWKNDSAKTKHKEPKY